MERQPVRRPWTRRLVRLGVVALVVVVGLLAAVPWLLGTAPARTALVDAVNRAIAPSKVGIGGVSASWFGSVRLDRVTLVDARGKTLVDARQAVIPRGLLGLAWNPRRLGTIVVEGAAVDIERRPDGSIDLVDALVPPAPAAEDRPKPTAQSEPPSAGRTEVTLRVVKGTLRLVTPEFVGPVVAGAFDMEATLPADATTPLGWKIRLGRPPGGSDADTLGIDGTYDHHADRDPNLTLAVQGANWPVALAGSALAGADLVARGKFDGTAQVERKAGQWSARGDARLLHLDADGPALAGDRLRLDRVAAGWDVAQAADAWTITRVKVESPVGTLNGRGATAGGTSGIPTGHLEATLDLAALSRQVPHALRLRDGLTLDQGTARLKADLAAGPGGTGQTLGIEAWLSDLTGRDRATNRAITLRDPATLTVQATRTATGLTVPSLALKARWADVKGSGDLDKGLTLNGTVDLAAFQAQFRDLVDFGSVELAGAGRMAADYRRAAPAAAGKPVGYVARYAAEIKALKLVGLTAGPIERETARFDVAASGPADASGMPAGWEQLRVNLKSARDVIALAATPKDAGKATAVSAAVSVPLDVLPSKLVERDGQLDGRLVATWTKEPAAVAIDELRVGLRTVDPTLASSATIGLAAKGRLELDADRLVLTPLPPAQGVVQPIGLAAEGLDLRGFRFGAVKDWAGRVAIVGDVAALDRANVAWNGAEPNGLAGALTGQLTLTPDGKGTLGYAGVVQVPDLSRPGPDGKGRRAEGPLILAARGGYEPATDRATIDEAGVVTHYGGLNTSGRVDEVTNRVVVDLRGNLSPAWPHLTAYLREAIEPGLNLAGGARAFRVKGPLIAGSLPALLKGLDAEVGIDLASADAFGLKLGPAPLVVRCAGGAVTMDRVVSTLNGGRVELVPGFDVDEARGIALTLAQGTAITDAAINDEVSRRLLRYVAPVLDEATHVNGRVSLRVDRGEIPLTGPPDRQLSLTGELTFQDVVFAPGPFAREMLTFVGQPDSPGLKLSQPVALSVADGRVLQKGLQIPVRRDVVVALEGSVGFDQTLDLRASVPLTRSMLGAAGTGLAAAGLDKALAGQRVVVPIGGTVKKPRVDRQALQVAVRELSRGLVGRGLQQQAAGLLDRVAPPPAAAAEPGAAAPPDPVKELGDEVLKRLTAPRRRRP